MVFKLWVFGHLVGRSKGDQVSPGGSDIVKSKHQHRPVWGWSAILTDHQQTKEYSHPTGLLLLLGLDPRLHRQDVLGGRGSSSRRRRPGGHRGRMQRVIGLMVVRAIGPAVRGGKSKTSVVPE